MSICTKQESEDFAFIFSSLRDILRELFLYDYKPDPLVADAAPAIQNGFMESFGYLSLDDFNRVTCWAHVEKACRPKAPSDEILDDIHYLQLCSSRAMFSYAYKLFKVKWTHHDQKTDEFLKYFDDWWIKRNYGWYEGYYEGNESVPTTNNG